MCLSHDIWYQIVQYFEHEEGDVAAAEKRMALLNLAVTSRLLSGLALATLWKNMKQLCPIVDVINSFTPPQEDLFLVWTEDGYDEYWVCLFETLALYYVADMEILNRSSRESLVEIKSAYV